MIVELILNFFLRLLHSRVLYLFLFLGFNSRVLILYLYLVSFVHLFLVDMLSLFLSHQSRV